jgi:hypothetical protein
MQGKVKNRDNAGFLLARNLQAEGFSFEDAELVMIEYARRVPKDLINPKNKYSRKDAIRNLKSAFKYAPRRPMLKDENRWSYLMKLWSWYINQGKWERTVNKTDILVLMGLASHGGWDGKGKIHPSQQTLADEIGIAKSTVCSSIKRLLNKGLLAIEKHPTISAEGFCRKYNSYELNVPVNEVPSIRI